MDQEGTKISRKERKAGKKRSWAFWDKMARFRDSLSVKFIGLKRINLPKAFFPARVLLAVTLALGLFAAGIYIGLYSAGMRLSSKGPEAGGLPVDITIGEKNKDRTQPSSGISTLPDKGLGSEPSTGNAAAGGKSSAPPTQSDTGGKEKAEPSAANPSVPQGSLSAEASAKNAPTLSNLEWPCQGQVVRRPGPYFSSDLGEWKFFEGIEIETTPGKEVRSVLPGAVKSITNSPKGLSIVIDHGFDIESTYVGVMTEMKVSDQVTKNQVIGKAQGKNVVFTIREKDDYKDPQDVLTKP